MPTKKKSQKKKVTKADVRLRARLKKAETHAATLLTTMKALLAVADFRAMVDEDEADLAFENARQAVQFDTGKGWVSPEAHRRVQAQAAAMREALEQIGAGPEDDSSVTWLWLFSKTETALAPKAGKALLERLQRAEEAVSDTSIPTAVHLARMDDLRERCAVAAQEWSDADDAPCGLVLFVVRGVPLEVTSS